MIAFEHVTKRYGERLALDDVSWRMDEGESVVVLFDVDGYDYAEIAQIMGVSVGTVKSRIHRGRLVLRTRLAPLRELFRG